MLDGAEAVGSFISSVRHSGAPLRVLLIVDPMDFTGSMWRQALDSAQALKLVDVDVCLTKMDLLPPAADADKMTASIVETLGTHGSSCIFALSSTTQNGVKQVVQHVHHVLSSGISVLLIGFANAGKSSLANVLAGKLRRIVLPVDPAVASTAVEAVDDRGVEFTVSRLPGTTVGVVSAPLLNYQGSSSTSLGTAQLYDSPGLVSGLTYTTLGASLYKNNLLADSICMSAKRKLRSLSVKTGQCMVIGRLFAIKVLIVRSCFVICNSNFGCRLFPAVNYCWDPMSRQF